MFILLLKILIVLIGAIYGAGLLAVWHCENQKEKMYRQVLAQLGFFKQLDLSMALRHTKIFKLENDYRQWLEMTESRQQFIFEKVLFLKNSSLKTKYKNTNCLQF